MHASSLSNCSCRRELQSRGLEDVRYVEEEVEAAAVGKGSVAVGEVADSVEADLVVLSTAGGRLAAGEGGCVEMRVAGMCWRSCIGA